MVLRPSTAAHAGAAFCDRNAESIRLSLARETYSAELVEIDDLYFELRVFMERVSSVVQSRP